MLKFLLSLALALCIHATHAGQLQAECPCGDSCKCAPCECPTLAECPDGKCVKSEPVVEGPQRSILANKPVRRLAALPAKALKKTAEAVCERRPVRRLLKAAARVAKAPLKAVRRARFSCGWR